MRRGKRRERWRGVCRGVGTGKEKDRGRREEGGEVARVIVVIVIEVGGAIDRGRGQEQGDDRR